MFVLLTTLFILALGKMVCQAQVSQEVKYLPSPSLPGRTTHSEHFNWTTSPEKIEPSGTLEKSVPYVIKNNYSNATTQQPIQNQPKLRLFKGRFQTRRMDHKRPLVDKVNANKTKNSTAVQNNTSNATQDIGNNSNNDDVYDKVVFEDYPPMEINSVKSDKQGARNGSQSDNPGATVTVTQPPPPANVTLEDRGAFDGDACPTGYVRVNGLCVMPD